MKELEYGQVCMLEESGYHSIRGWFIDVEEAVYVVVENAVKSVVDGVILSMLCGKIYLFNTRYKSKLYSEKIMI